MFLDCHKFYYSLNTCIHLCCYEKSLQIYWNLWFPWQTGSTDFMGWMLPTPALRYVQILTNIYLFSWRLKSSRQFPVAILNKGWNAYSNTCIARSETKYKLKTFHLYGIHIKKCKTEILTLNLVWEHISSSTFDIPSTSWLEGTAVILSCPGIYVSFWCLILLCAFCCAVYLSSGLFSSARLFPPLGIFDLIVGHLVWSF